MAAEIDGVTATVPTEIMCGESLCLIMMHGVLLYRDETHLNADGAAHLGYYFQLPKLGE